MLAGTADPKSGSLISDYTANLGQLVSRGSAEKALRAAAVESAMASRAKSEFLANMSHELRTPLNAIIGFSELVENISSTSFVTSKHQEYAKNINSAGHHLLQIINDILDISRIESRFFDLEIEAHNPKRIVDACVLLVKDRIEKKKQKLIVRVPDTLPAIAADGLRLKQILINLITNATNFTDQGGHVEIFAGCNQDETITIAIKDSGCGLTEEEIDYVMKPFTQLASCYARDHQGTGLGLPITQALTLRLGGEFDIKSTPDVGTEVSITLPQAGAQLLGQIDSAANSEEQG